MHDTIRWFKCKIKPPKKKTKKFQTIAHDEENKRKQWADFLVSFATDKIFHEIFLFYKRTLKLNIWLASPAGLTVEFNTEATRII